VLFDLITRITEKVRPYADLLILAGMLGIALTTWRRWRHDRARWTNPPIPMLTSADEWPRQPQVSVLVAAWNEAENIERHLRSFLELDYLHKELVLCAGGPDGTYDLARRWAGPQVTVLEQQPGEGKQRALQHCLTQAQGTTILLTDADCEFSDEAFIRLLEPLAQRDAQVVTGVSQPRTDQQDNPLVQYQWFGDLWWSYRMPPTVDGVLGRNCALRRDVLTAIGEFKTPVRTGTDYYLSRLLVQGGYTIHAAPHSRIATEYPATPRAYLRMWRRWNKNLIIHGLNFRAWKDVRGIASALALYGSILLLVFLSPFLGPIALEMGALLFGIAIANRLYRLAIGARLAGKQLSWQNVLGLPLYTCLDMMAAFLAVRDSATTQRRGRW